MNYYGIEIELERARHAGGYPLEGWRMLGDGSLRNGGLEFVFSHPTAFTDVAYLLDVLSFHIKELAPDAEANERCSTHIHMDVRDLGKDEMVNVLLNYELVEPMLFKHMAAEREDNHFCVPHYMTKDINARSICYIKDFNLNALYRNTHKYSAFNLRTIRDLSTMEWRHFPAVLPVTNVMQWVEMIDDFKETSRKHGVWSEVIAQDFCSKWFGGFDEDLIDAGMETLLYTQEALESEDNLIDITRQKVGEVRRAMLNRSLEQMARTEDRSADEIEWHTPAPSFDEFVERVVQRQHRPEDERAGEIFDELFTEF